MSTGYIEAINPKETSVGTMYDYVISGETLGAGKFPPKNVAVGDYVYYETEMRGNYKNLISKSVKKTMKPEGAPAMAAAPAANPAPTGPGSASAYAGRTNDTQDVISRQAAANTAIAFVELLVKADCLPIPAAAKKDVRADLMEEILKTYMAKFHAWNVHKDFDFGKKEDPSDPLDLKSMEDKEVWDE